MSLDKETEPYEHTDLMHAKYFEHDPKRKVRQKSSMNKISLIRTEF